MCGRNLSDKLVSEHLAYVIILNNHRYTFTFYLFDRLTLFDEPLLDGGLLGPFSEIGKIDPDDLSEQPHHQLILVSGLELPYCA